MTADQLRRAEGNDDKPFIWRRVHDQAQDPGGREPGKKQGDGKGSQTTEGKRQPKAEAKGEEKAK